MEIKTMKKTYLVSAVTVLTAGILAACNSNESDGVVTLAPTASPTAHREAETAKAHRG